MSIFFIKSKKQSLKPKNSLKSHKIPKCLILAERAIQSRIAGETATELFLPESLATS